MLCAVHKGGLTFSCFAVPMRTFMCIASCEHFVELDRELIHLNYELFLLLQLHPMCCFPAIILHMTRLIG